MNEVSSNLPLAGQVAIITGASSGIGLAIAEAFAEAGAHIVIAARSAERLGVAATRLRRHGTRIEPVAADITNDADIELIFAAAMAITGRLDILVNNAGISTRAPTTELSPAAFRAVIDLNVTAAFLCAQAALRQMIAQNGGRIINIGSVSARVPRANSVPYTTSKFALEGMNRALALDGRAHGVAVSILHPGNTESDIWLGAEHITEREGVMAGAQVARAALLMATLPAGINMLDATMLPLQMPLIGRG
jgi:NAD(P)-dependent dehydrogenase (short-subunit alcohol dehydrogenase family)